MAGARVTDPRDGEGDGALSRCARQVQRCASLRAGCVMPWVCRLSRGSACCRRLRSLLRVAVVSRRVLPLPSRSHSWQPLSLVVVVDRRRRPLLQGCASPHAGCATPWLCRLSRCGACWHGLRSLLRAAVVSRRALPLPRRSHSWQPLSLAVVGRPSRGSDDQAGTPRPCATWPRWC